MVLECGAVPVLVALAGGAAADDVRDQAVWALGNVAGDSPRCRDAVLAAGALPPLIQCVRACAAVARHALRRRRSLAPHPQDPQQVHAPVDDEERRVDAVQPVSREEPADRLRGGSAG